MSVLDIVTWPDARLTAVCAPVAPSAAGVYAPFVSAELLERHGPCAPAAASCAAMLVVFAVACAELRASDEGVPKEAPQPRGPVTRRRAKAMKAD